MEGKMPNAGNKLVIEMAPWTNGDAIRDMTDEELAEFFSETCCPSKFGGKGNCEVGCVECWLDWLREEVADG